MIVAFERFEKLDRDGLPSDRLAEFLEAITRQVNANTVLTGSGSPEGVREADPTTLYMDTSGSAGSILYVKKTGTGDTGWVLV
jgi:hypothetical protein